MLERTQAKEAQKRMGAAVKAANGIIAKSGPAVISIESLLQKPEMDMVAPIIKDPLTASLTQLQEFDSSARAVIASGGADELTVDVKEVQQTITLAKKQQQLAVSMLATLARAK